MNKTTDTVDLRACEVKLVTLLDERDRTIADRVVFSETPGHLISDHSWGATLSRRIGECAIVRDYLATFAHTEDGARRVLQVALGLGRAANHEGASGAAANAVAGWCALSLGRWELADALAIRSESAEPNKLAEQIRKAVAGKWFSVVLGIENEVAVADIRERSALVLGELTEPRACLKLR